MPTRLALLALLAAWPARADQAETAAYERLRSASDDVRAAVCPELARPPLRGPRARAELLEALLDPSDRVRMAAAKALATFDERDVLGRIEQMIKTEPAAAFRRDLAVALSTEPARLHDPETTALLASLLTDDPSPEVRLALAKALAARDDRGALAAERRAASDPDKRVRAAADAGARQLDRPLPKARPWRPETPKADAVKGKDECPSPWGWCECDGPIKRPPKCMQRKECRVEVDTVLQLGMPCTWDGLAFGAPN
jgi:HEAT repeat protein